MRPKENAQAIQHAQGFTTTVVLRDITNALMYLNYPLLDVDLLSIQKVITLSRLLSLLNERLLCKIEICIKELIVTIYFY